MKKHIKHLIITRFMSTEFSKTDKGVLFDPKFLMDSSVTMKKHLLSSLSIQTNKDFELVILIHNEIDKEKVSFLFNLQPDYPFKITVLRSNQLEPYVDSFKHIYDFVITSRIDYDDHIHKSVVDETQRTVDEGYYGAKLYGLRNGVSVVDGETEAHLMPFLNYGFGGFFSAFETLILNTNEVKNLFSIYALGNHTAVCKELTTNREKYGVGDASVECEWDSVEDIRYIWIRHKNAESVIHGNTIHITDHVVSDLNFLSDFGYNI